MDNNWSAVITSYPLYLHFSTRRRVLLDNRISCYCNSRIGLFSVYEKEEKLFTQLQFTDVWKEKIVYQVDYVTNIFKQPPSIKCMHNEVNYISCVATLFRSDEKHHCPNTLVFS